MSEREREGGREGGREGDNFLQGNLRAVRHHFRHSGVCGNERECACVRVRVRVRVRASFFNHLCMCVHDMILTIELLYDNAIIIRYISV